MLHVHDLNHVEVDAAYLASFLVSWPLLRDGLYSIDEDIAKWIAECWMNFGVERRSGDVHEKFPLWRLLLFESLQELEDLHLSEFDTVDERTWMYTITDISLSLSHDLTNEENT